MKTEITVRIVSADEGYFIGRVVGYRGVWATGSSVDDVAERVADAWIAMYGDDYFRTDNKVVSSFKASEQKMLLQVAA